MGVKQKDVLAIILVAALLFIPFLGKVHLFDWDDINFAESAREMIVTGDYFHVQINYQQFWEKPPLFIWMQVASMKVFGVNEFAARFPNAIAGIATLVALYLIGFKLFNRKFALIWVLVYSASVTPHLYFKSGLIDPWFNLFMFLSCYFLFRLCIKDRQAKSYKFALLAGLAGGLAVLTKGPVAILLVGLTFIIYWLIKKTKTGIRLPEFLLVLVTGLLTTFLWFGFEVLNNGWWFMSEFINYQIELLKKPVAGHAGPFFYHWVVVLIGCFPASIFLFLAFSKKQNLKLKQNAYKLWMVIMLLVVLVIFSIVKTKIVHYSSLAYFPVGFLAALGIYNWLKGEAKFKIAHKILLSIVGFIYVTAGILFPILGKNPTTLAPLIKDQFGKANLQAIVNWSYAEMLVGIVLLAGIIVFFTFSFKQQKQKAVLALLVSSIMFVQCFLYIFVPKIELYSQNAAVEFYKSQQGKNVYVDVAGFKSYAQLFYAKKTNPVNKNALDNKWLTEGEIDKTTYLVTKINRADEYGAKPGYEELYRKNGFVFFKREPKN